MLNILELYFGKSYIILEMLLPDAKKLIKKSSKNFVFVEVSRRRYFDRRVLIRRHADMYLLYILYIFAKCADIYLYKRRSTSFPLSGFNKM
jgi:hypothetical protein